MFGLDYIHNGLNERRRSEELAAVLCALHGKFHEEVFIDAPEQVSTGGAEHVTVKDAKEIFQEVVAKLVVILGKLVEQRLEVALNGIHGLNQGCSQVRAFGKLEQLVVTSYLRQHEGAPFEKVSLDERPFRHSLGGLVPGNLAAGGLVTVRGMPQEDDTQHRHAIFRRG